LACNSSSQRKWRAAKWLTRAIKKAKNEKAHVSMSVDALGATKKWQPHCVKRERNCRFIYKLPSEAACFFLLKALLSDNLLFGGITV
jgi:hypothetical protein